MIEQVVRVLRAERAGAGALRGRGKGRMGRPRA
jgi:hypothetical protein